MVLCKCRYMQDSCSNVAKMLTEDFFGGHFFVSQRIYLLIDDIVNYGINEYIICSVNCICLYLDEINGWFDKVKKIFEEKEETICALFPQYRIKKMTDLIKRNIVFRISMTSQAFKISDKTAISYLKILENGNIVASTMYGRDKVYFNSNIIDNGESSKNGAEEQKKLYYSAKL